MPNGRLYLHAWLIATIALLVAFLTLRSPDPLPQTTQPVQFAGNPTTDLAKRLQLAAPLRIPGTTGADAAEKWITAQFNAIPNSDDAVVQRGVVRRINTDGHTVDVPFANVIFTVPARDANKVQRRIIVVAPRDAPRQVSGGTSGTAILSELARLSVQQKYHHPLVFVSVDADTFGNAGFRYYLSRTERKRIAGVIVLDAPGEGRDRVAVMDKATGKQVLDPSNGQPKTEPAADANTIYLWSNGAGRQALDIRRLADRAVSAAGYTASPLPSLRRQLLRLSVTETRGAQRAAIDLGIPAVTLSARPESLLPVDVPDISIPRVRAAGSATLALIGLLDDRERAKVPDRALAYAGRILRPAVAQLALLFLTLPLLVMALDAGTRIRRSRVRLGAGVRAVAWRQLPAMVALLLGWLLTLAGVLHAPEVGRPDSPADIPFDGQATLAILLIVLATIAVVMLIRPRVGNVGAHPSAETAGALVWLCGAVLVAWWVMPYSLVLILPAAHAILAATVAPRLWQLILLGVAAVIAPIAVVLNISAVVDRGVPFGVWYLFQTTFSGARGFLGPVIAAVIIVCLATLASLVVARVHEGLVHADDMKKGLGWLTSNLSARKRRVGVTHGDTTEKT